MSSARVLVVEDDPMIRSMIAELLTSEGMSVTEASDGEEALARLADGGFDLVITDVVMPAQYGVHVVASARTAGEQVPTLVITAHREEWINDSVERLDEAEILHKPFSAEQLMVSVRSLLAQPERPRMSDAQQQQ